MGEITKKLALSFCFTALLAPSGLTACAGGSDEPRRPAAQLAADGPLALSLEPSSPPGGEGEDTTGTVTAQDSWDHPDQDLGWQWPEERLAGSEEPSADATAPPARQTGETTGDPKKAGEIWDHPDQGLGWQWPVTDTPPTP